MKSQRVTALTVVIILLLAAHVDGQFNFFRRNRCNIRLRCFSFQCFRTCTTLRFARGNCIANPYPCQWFGTGPVCACFRNASQNLTTAATPTTLITASMLVTSSDQFSTSTPTPSSPSNATSNSTFTDTSVSTFSASTDSTFSASTGSTFNDTTASTFNDTTASTFNSTRTTLVI